MKEILLAHALRYPAMEPADAVKLLYQSEFGGGHLIQNETVCLDRLLAEYQSTPQSRDIPLLENIGGGIVRVCLGALDAHGYDIHQLGQDFIRSAAQPRGSLEHFRKKLSLLEELTRAGQIPFSPAALTQYLNAYEAAGYPAVSHSDGYRRSYRPAYRVMDSAFLPSFIKMSRM